jgi:hypothetical protein
VAKKKDGKALFEVFGTGAATPGKGLGVPGWFGLSRPEAKGAPVAPGAPADGGALTSPPPALPVVNAAAGDAAGAGQADDGPMVFVQGQRVIISLNKVSALAAGLVLMLLVAGAFFIGRRSAAPAPERPAEQAVGKAVEPGVEPRAAANAGNGASAEANPRVDAGMPDDAIVREKNLDYLVIQDGIGFDKDAQDIKAFLFANSVLATVGKGAGNRLMVKGLAGFRDPSTAEALDYKHKVEVLGKEYKAKCIKDRKPRWYEFDGCEFQLEKK